MDRRFVAPRRRIMARKLFAVPVLAALFLAFTGLAPANAALASTALPSTAPANAAQSYQAPSYPDGRTEVSLSANGNFQLVFDGDAAQVVGQVLPMVPDGKVPTGTVQLLPDVGSTVLGTDVLSDNILPGLFVLITPTLSLGTHYFRAAYSGDSNFAPKSIRFPVVVHTGPFSQTTLSVSPSGTSTAGQAVTITAAVESSTGPMTFHPVGGNSVSD